MKILLVMDMLNDFCDKEKGALPFQTARDIIPFVKERIDTYQADEDSIVMYLKEAHSDDDLEFLRFPKHGVINTWGSKIIPELPVTDTDKIFEKTRYSGFYNTPLSGVLEVMHKIHTIEHVEVVGVCTSICVMDTVGGLANRDYKVIVPRAGVADFDQANHENALTRMEKLYGAELV